LVSTLPSYTFPPIPHYSTAFNICHYILYQHRCYLFQYCCLYNFLFLSSSPEFHRVVPVWQICFTYKFVYDHVGFCVIYIVLFFWNPM
jgi:hypothetical protein